MIIADRKKVLFVHIEKTGGSSITTLLTPHISKKYRSENAKMPGSGSGWRQTWHINRQHARFSSSLPLLDKFGIDPQEYFKFTVVRNPYSWLLSIWGNRYQSPMNVKKTLSNRLRFIVAELTGIKKFHSQHFHQMYPDGSFKSFVLFIDYLVSNYPPSFTKGYLGVDDQYSYIENDRNFKFDFIAKLENLDRDLNKINQIVHLNDDLKVPHLNKESKTKNREKYLDFYDDESIAIVNRIFARDFKFFGYQPIANLAEYQKDSVAV